jgi:hypothetical protein
MVLANANPPVYQMGQEVIQDGLQILLFHLTLTLKIEEDMEFHIGLSVKEFQEIF